MSKLTKQVINRTYLFDDRGRAFPYQERLERPLADIELLRKEILEFVKNEYLTDEDNVELTSDTKLISSGIVDSFSMVSLKTYLERKFKISIPDGQATPDAFDTVNQIAALVAGYVK